MRGRAHRVVAWWKRRRRQQKLAILLGIAGLIVLVVVLTTQVFFEPEPPTRVAPNQTEPDEATRMELAKRFAPILRLDSRELFVPVDRSVYLSATALEKRDHGKLTVLDEDPGVDELPTSAEGCTAKVRCAIFLDIEGVEPPRSKPAAYDAIEERALTGGDHPAIHVHVTQYDDTGEYAIQYWFLYFYNHRLNQHESDWEQITLRLDSEKKPVEAFYSSHEAGTRKTWSKLEHDGDHPVVYVAQGTHANYFTRGTHSVTIACTPLLKAARVCVRKRTIRDRTNGRKVLNETDYGLAELTGPIFVGGYGSGNYVAGKRIKGNVSDPRTRRPAWSDPLERLRAATKLARVA